MAASTVVSASGQSRPFAAASGLTVAAVVAALTGTGLQILLRVSADVAVVSWELMQGSSFTLAASVLGGILLRHAAARSVGTVLLVSGASGAAAILLGSLGDLALLQGSPAAAALQLVTACLWPFFVVVPLTFLPLVFPSGILPGRLWRAVSGIAIVTIAALVLATATDATVPTGGLGGPPITNPLALPELSLILQAVAQPLALVAALASASALVVRWAKGSLLERQQVVMLAASVAVMLSLALVGPALPPPAFQLGVTVAPLLIVASIAVAVLRFELYDIHVVVHRVALYSTLTAALTAVFFAVYLVVLGIAAQIPSANSPWLAAAIGACVVVLCAEPGRRRLQARLERRFLGERGRPLVAMARLRDAMLELEDAAVLRSITGTIAGAVRSPGATVVLVEDGWLQTAPAEDDGWRRPLVLPLLYRQERLGELRVDRRTPGEAYGARDRELLMQLADQAAAIVYVLRRDAELAAARREAISLAAEERARLGRDLHDGLGPLLAGAGLTAEALRRGLEPGSTDEADAARLAERLRVAAGEVRRFAHGLQPTALADVGLARALHDHLRPLRGPGVPSFDLRIDVGSLPAAVEQAAYFVVLEAVGNVIRHAEASSAKVVVVRDPAALMIAVEDDGIGIAAPYVSGVGLSSMRRRVQALDGSFSIIPGASGGTTVTAIIPVPE